MNFFYEVKIVLSSGNKVTIPCYSMEEVSNIKEHFMDSESTMIVTRVSEVLAE